MKRNLLNLLTLLIVLFSICANVFAQTGKDIGLVSGALEWKSVTDSTYGKGFQCNQWEGVTVSLFKGTCSVRDVNEPRSYMGQNGGMVLIIDGGSQNMTTITLDYSSGSGFNHGLVPSTGTVTVDEATRTTTWIGNANKVVFTTDYAENLYNRYERIFVYTDGAAIPDIPNLSNTAATAYSVTKARELLTKYKKANAKIYVKGKVSYIKEYLSTYGTITYYISETGDPNEPQFMIYSGKNVDSTRFESKDDLHIGDEVTVYGEMRYYGSDLELYQNNYLVNSKGVLNIPFGEGTYYFRNAEAGTFLAGSNSWGTRLSLKSAGDPIEATKDGEGYKLRDMALLGSNTSVYIAQAEDDAMFIDQRLTPTGGIKITRLSTSDIRWYNTTYSALFDEDKAYYFMHFDSKTGEHVYIQGDSIIKNWENGGSGYCEVNGVGIDELTGRPDIAAIWEIMTREQLADDLYNNATPENMMSASSFIMNPDFSRGYNVGGNVNENHWTVEEAISDVYGANQNFLAGAYNKTFNLYQKITDLPNGNYAILVQGVYEGTKTGTGTNPRFYVKEDSTTYSKQFKYVEGTAQIAEWSKRFYDNPRNPNAEVGSNNNEYLYTLDSIYVTVYDHTLTIGFEGERTDVKAYFDNVQLIYKGKADSLNDNTGGMNNGDYNPTDTIASDSIIVDLSKPIVNESENCDSPVHVEGENGDYYVYKPINISEEFGITLNVPVDVIESGITFTFSIVLTPSFVNNNSSTLGFALKGGPHKLSSRPSSPSVDVINIPLGNYVYNNEEEVTLRYEFTLDCDIESPVIQITSSIPSEAVDPESASIGIKSIALTKDEVVTMIDSHKEDKTVEAVEYYDIMGRKLSSFQKGINIVKFSDGSIRKVRM